MRMHCIIHIKMLVFRRLLLAFLSISVDIGGSGGGGDGVRDACCFYSSHIPPREREKKQLPQDARCDAAHIVIHYTCMYRKYVHWTVQFDLVLTETEKLLP